jgi:hypothetical protein
MGWQKLLRRLRREITGNPKKAAVLGLLLAVAFWFWAPLVGGWLGKSEVAEDVMPQAVATESTPEALGGSVVATATSKTPVPPWPKVAALIEADRRMQPALAAADRDPFAAPLPPAAAPAAESIVEAPQPPPVEVTPQAAGLTLSSTLVGPARRLALIDGKPYREGSKVRARQRDAEFELVEIHPRVVVLAREGRHYELRIPTPNFDGSP